MEKTHEHVRECIDSPWKEQEKEVTVSGWLKARGKKGDDFLIVFYTFWIYTMFTYNLLLIKVTYYVWLERKLELVWGWGGSKFSRLLQQVFQVSEVGGLEKKKKDGTLE